jgi:adenylosuccinate synthase
MPVSIVVGGQFGSEGKGKVAHFFAKMNSDIRFVVRCGGPNSGHTVIDRHGRRRIFQQLPTASILPNINLAICSGSYIDLDILFREIKETNLDRNRLFIDKDAVIITKDIKGREKDGGLIEKIGSTGSGTGAAVASRVNREDKLCFAKDINELAPYLADVPKILRATLRNKERVLIEGTQGFGLSPLHGRFFPYTTSRDTTAAAFLSETGLSPIDVDEVILTIRAFPIRVAGNSGPLTNEIDWETLRKNAGSLTNIEEYTSVTKKVRRVAMFDPEIVRKAIRVNNPTVIVINHLDYIAPDPHMAGFDRISNFIVNIEKVIGNPIDFVGFGPDKIMNSSIYENSMEKGYDCIE